MRLFVTGSRRWGIWGLRIGSRYLSLASPRHRPLYSERNRRGVSVLPLIGGWRIRFRKDAI